MGAIYPVQTGPGASPTWDYTQAPSGVLTLVEAMNPLQG